MLAFISIFKCLCRLTTPTLFLSSCTLLLHFMVSPSQARLLGTPSLTCFNSPLLNTCVTRPFMLTLLKPLYYASSWTLSLQRGTPSLTHVLALTPFPEMPLWLFLLHRHSFPIYLTVPLYSEILNYPARHSSTCFDLQSANACMALPISLALLSSPLFSSHRLATRARCPRRMSGHTRSPPP